jgi:hypothetical protein
LSAYAEAVGNERRRKITESKLAITERNEQSKEVKQTGKIISPSTTGKEEDRKAHKAAE